MESDETVATGERSPETHPRIPGPLAPGPVAPETVGPDGAPLDPLAPTGGPIRIQAHGFLALMVALSGLLVVVHLGLVFLSVAPSNTVSKKYAQQVDDWIYPWFEQNWSMFAPNPTSSNETIEVRVRNGDNGVPSPWIDLTAADYAEIRHNPFPSHETQNQLRRAWDAYSGQGNVMLPPTTTRAEIFKEYVRNIAVVRLRDHRTGPYSELQLRVTWQGVTPPDGPRPAPNVTELPWWSV